MEISDADLLAEAREMALYVRFLEKDNARLEQQVAALTAENTPPADPSQDADQQNP